MSIDYVVGIDVGLYSTGLAAIEVDSAGNPLRILNMESVIHDGGVDPNSNKTGDTRKLVSGVARRTRRMRRRRRERLRKLDQYLLEHGYPVEEYGDDTLKPWMTRAELADGHIADDEERKAMLSVAFRHIARHRGWRNPYKSVKSLYTVHVEDLSAQYGELCDYCAVNPEDAFTPGQVIAEYIDENQGRPAPRLRKNDEHKDAPLPQRLMQEDNAYEVRYICQQQGIDEKTYRELIDKVFFAKSPKGSASKRVANDDLTREPRALKASLAFQKFRIAAALSNISIQSDSEKRPLSINEKQRAFDALTAMGESERPTWNDIAHELGITRRDIKGIGGIQDDGERISNKAPVMESYFALTEAGGQLKQLVKKCILPWWDQAEEDEKESLIELLGNTVDIDAVREDVTYASAFELIDSLDDEDLAQLDKISLPSGRAAYSVRACNELTERILTTDDNLHDARKALYGVTDFWRPAQEPVGASIGNPSVDRVLKIVNRYLMNVTDRWGKPHSVNIEHTRSGFSSTKVSRSYQHDTEARANFRDSIFHAMKEAYPEINRYQDSQIKRWEAVQRQNGRCLYCGRQISFTTCELDHIVPRKGVGATNTKTNLAAVCADCNKDKLNTLFSKWCHSEYAQQHNISVKNAIARVEMFNFPAKQYNAREIRNFKAAVKARLAQTTEDEAPDNRSIESVAWMADELHRRIDWFYNSERYTATDDDARPTREVNVRVYPGRITDLARKFSGISKQIHFAGASWKTRLDRRHHAVDAAVIAMMSQTIAVFLNNKDELRKAQTYSHKENEQDWKEYPAGDPLAPLYFEWRDRMNRLLELINERLDADYVPIVRSLRLELGNSQAHEDTIHKLLKVRLGDELSADLIKRAATPALYTALTRCEAYDANDGLPADDERSITVNGEHFSASDNVEFFESSAAQIKVNNGSVEIGDGFHHARIYKCVKRNKAGKETGYFFGMIRVFAVDLNRSRNEDLLTAELPAQSLSMRYGDPSTVRAILNGDAEFVGHLFIGDEIRVDATASSYTGQAKDFADMMGELAIPAVCTTWVVEGFGDPAKLRLRPSYLAEEGLKNSELDIAEKISKMFTPGWRPAVNALAAFNPTVIRRNGLGETRWTSQAGLPVSYRWDS